LGGGETFVVANARRLRVMGVAAAASAVVWVMGLALVALGAVVASFSVVASLSVALVFCVALATVAAALSLLTDSAADLKSDNDLVV
jgi:biotin-(acetyl-CoA carboxylase) ligase